MGVEGAAVATARTRFLRVYLCKGCQHTQIHREYWMARLGSSLNELFSMRAPRCSSTSPYQLRIENKSLQSDLVPRPP